MDRVLPRLIFLPFYYSTKALLSSLVTEDYTEKTEASTDNNDNNNAEGGLMKKDSSPEGAAAKSPTSSSTTTSTATFTLHNTFMDIVIR